MSRNDEICAIISDLENILARIDGLDILGVARSAALLHSSIESLRDIHSARVQRVGKSTIGPKSD